MAAVSLRKTFSYQTSMQPFIRACSERLPTTRTRVAMQAIICEFSPATASVMGLPWEVHERCRATLEAALLCDFFVHAVRIATSSAAPALEGRDDGLCLACISLISAVLGWEFR